MSFADFFDSDRNLILTVVAVLAILVIACWGFVAAFPNDLPSSRSSPSGPLHMTVKVTSAYVYNTALFSSRLGTVSSPVEDIKLNATGFVYTLSCTYYQVNMTLTMTNNSGAWVSTGYETDNGVFSPWTFDSLHEGCELFAVSQQ